MVDSVAWNMERERWGRRVREEWIAWALEQPNPKPSWLVEWDGMAETDKEADRRIGEALYLMGFADGFRAGKKSASTG